MRVAKGTRLGESVTGEIKRMRPGETQKCAHVVGDPETLSPASVEYLSTAAWNALGAFGKRLILAGVDND